MENTSSSSESIIVTDEELRSLTDVIQKRHGIDFSCYEPKSLKRRVIRALHIFKMNSVHELWTKILRDHTFIYSFMNEISVGLTAMFRDPMVWRKIKQVLNSEYKNHENINLWHAGCSSGEEVYTMSIVMQESSYHNKIKALATDISNQALENAFQGIYSPIKMVEYDNNYLEYNPGNSLKKYYTTNKDGSQMQRNLIQNVSFKYHNLITDPIEQKFDIIFCRNVMIYFDNKAKSMLFDKFYNALTPGGMFIIGFYDAILPLVDPKKFSVYDIDAKIFKKI